MQKTHYVIGHRNPDTDSIASAIAYAALKERQGVSGVVAAMAGEPNPRPAIVTGIATGTTLFLVPLSLDCRPM